MSSKASKSILQTASSKSSGMLLDGVVKGVNKTLFFDD